MTNAVETVATKVLAWLEKAGKKSVEAVEVIGDVASKIVSQIASGKTMTAPVKSSLQLILQDAEAVGTAFLAAGGADGANVGSDSAFLSACVKFSADFLAQLPTLVAFAETIGSDVTTDLQTAQAAAKAS